jgi:hypothetical protein
MTESNPLMFCRKEMNQAMAFPVTKEDDDAYV